MALLVIPADFSDLLRRPEAPNGSLESHALLAALAYPWRIDPNLTARMRRECPSHFIYVNCRWRGDYLLTLTTQCESFIERVFYVYHIAHAYHYRQTTGIILPVMLRPQVPLVTALQPRRVRRADFLLSVRAPYEDRWLQQMRTPPLLAVECDGRKWHASSPQQVEAGYRRDRELIEAGVLPIHYSGAEIVANPNGCVQNMLRVMETLWNTSV